MTQAYNNNKHETMLCLKLQAKNSEFENGRKIEMFVQIIAFVTHMTGRLGKVSRKELAGRKGIDEDEIN